MKIVFAGPSLHGTALPLPLCDGMQLRPPARQGDVRRAVEDGATAIGLIDGVFGEVPAVWHKEILFGLERGVAMFGAASMGALRAAECDRYGMIGIGLVYEAYRSGAVVDDDAVAQIHAPEEFGFEPLTEALVNIEATLTACVAAGALSVTMAHGLAETARGLHFTERVWDRILQLSPVPAWEAKALPSALALHRRTVKTEDALALLHRIGAVTPPLDTVAG